MDKLDFQNVKTHKIERSQSLRSIASETTVLEWQLTSRVSADSTIFSGSRKWLKSALNRQD